LGIAIFADSQGQLREQEREKTVEDGGGRVVGATGRKQSKAKLAEKKMQGGDELAGA